MNVRTTLPVALSLVVAAGAVAPAVAAPPKKPKPITASYALELLPAPVPVATGVDGDNSCVNPELEGVSIDTRTIKTTGAGTLVVDVSKFAGDWDITVTDAKGKVLGIGSGTTTADPSSLGTDLKEKAIVKTKRATVLNIAVCNFAGGPQAAAKYVFTYK